MVAELLMTSTTFLYVILADIIRFINRVPNFSNKLNFLTGLPAGQNAGMSFYSAFQNGFSPHVGDTQYC